MHSQSTSKEYGKSLRVTSIIGAVLAIFSLLAVQPAVSAEKKAAEVPQAAAEKEKGDEGTRAKELLAKAVTYYKANKKKALAVFGRQGEFTSGDLYVYVVGTNGVFLASGGSSFVLVDRIVTNMPDATGKLFFKEMLEMAESKGSGSIEYRWMNRADRKVERKTAYFEKVDDKIIAVGYYIPHASPEQAKEMLKVAVEAVKSDPERAFTDFNNINGKFIEDDLYVYAINLDDGRFRAHGAMPRLVGTDAYKLNDPTGKPIAKEMISVVKSKGQGEIDYTWRNPVTRKLEKKHAYLQKVNNYLVAVGYYVQ